MTESEKIELAIRRVSDRLKQRVPWDMGVTEAFDELADELAGIKPSGLPMTKDKP